jgi:maltose-binding protein MalE
MPCSKHKKKPKTLKDLYKASKKATKKDKKKTYTPTTITGVRG